MVLISGASGFVGSNLSSHLAKNQLNVKEINLRDPLWRDSMDLSASVIIHLAGKAQDDTDDSKLENFLSVNRDLTMQLFEKFLTSAINDFFFISSIKVVGDCGDEIITEQSRANPTGPYGKSKWEAEKYLLSQKIPPNKRLFIIRPCLIHGPGNEGNLQLLFKFVKSGVPWPLGSFDNKRSFLSIGNFNYLILKMIQDNKIASGVYNFSDDVPLSVNQVICLIADELGKKTKIWKLNKKLLQILAKFGSILSLPINSAKLEKLTTSSMISNQKIKQNLGIEHLPFTPETGLRHTISYFKNKHS